MNYMFKSKKGLFFSCVFLIVLIMGISMVSATNDTQVITNDNTLDSTDEQNDEKYSNIKNDNNFNLSNPNKITNSVSENTAKNNDSYLEQQDSINNKFIDKFNKTYNNSNIIEVSNSTDSEFSAIQNVINDAPNGSRIHLTGKFTSNGNMSSIHINKNLLIYGNATLDARHLSRIFVIDSGKVVLSNLNLINGYANNDCKGYGSAIYIKNQTISTSLISSDCYYFNNTCSNDHGHFIDCQNRSSVLLIGDKINHIDESSGDIWDIDYGRAFSFHISKNIDNTDSLKKASYIVNNHYYDYVIVNFKPSAHITFTAKDIGVRDVFRPKAANFIINGYNAYVQCINHVISEFWDLTKTGCNFLSNDASNVRINNLTIGGFCSASINYGNLVLNNTTVKDSNNLRITLTIHDIVSVKTAGAALINFGTCTCDHSKFNHNTGYQAGAISSINGMLKLINTDFKYNNIGCHDGDGIDSTSFWNIINGEYYAKNCDIYAKDSIIKIYSINKTKPNLRNSTRYGDTKSYKDNEIVISRESQSPAIVFRDSLEDYVENITITSKDEFEKLALMCRDYSNYDQINVFIDSTDSYEKKYTFSESDFDDYCILKPLVNININGNGFNIATEEITSSDVTHFIANNMPSVTVKITNMIITGFNTAIINSGNLICDSTTFEHNKIDYNYAEDYGGAIKNHGSLILSNCTFNDNYAKYGGAIYNTGSIIFLNQNIFTNNTAYAGGFGNIINWITTTSDGSNSGDIYNKEGQITGDNSSTARLNLTNNHENWFGKHTSTIIAISSAIVSLIPVVGPWVGYAAIIYSTEAAIHTYINKHYTSYSTLDTDKRETTKLIKKIATNVVILGVQIAIHCSTKHTNPENPENQEIEKTVLEPTEVNPKAKNIDTPIGEIAKRVVHRIYDETPTMDISLEMDLERSIHYI